MYFYINLHGLMWVNCEFDWLKYDTFCFPLKKTQHIAQLQQLYSKVLDITRFYNPSMPHIIFDNQVRLYVLVRVESFGWILLNLEFICVISTVPSYLGHWGKRVNFGNDVAKIQQKYEREREKVGERKFWISVITLLKFLLSKPADRKPIVAMPLLK